MSASKKIIENAQRLRYTRAIERFHRSILSFFLHSQDITKESLNKKILNAEKILDRVEEIALYKGELQDLQRLVKKIINYKKSEKKIEDIKSEVLYDSNQLEKNKNARRYKKDKYNNWK